LIDELLAFAGGGNATLRDEALRDLVGVALSSRQREQLERLDQSHPEAAGLVARGLGKSFHTNRPAVADLDAWLKRLEEPADIEAGRRVFAHGKLAACARCHRIDGRGRDVGPDLSTIGRVARRSILESILQPSNAVAPAYQVWEIEMKNGKVHTGMLVGTVLDDYTYVDEKGAAFKVNTRDVEQTRGVAKSIMPDGLADFLTDQELRDLLAYLCSKK